ncbi:MAG: OB-fold nucleic acid binding domain-containing protein, partial [Selenomonadaceae bacterium]
GDTMCFAEVEDYTRAIEVIVFPNLFLQKMELLEPDMPVVVEGRVDITDNGAKLIANQMWSLDEYKPDYFITIHGAKDTPENMTQLKNVFDKYHGEHVVYLFFVDKHKKIRTQPALWLNESPHVKEEIEKILGDGTVRQR